MESSPPLVDQFILVGIKKEANSYRPYIKHALPPELSKSAERVHMFCFPEGTDQLAANPKNHTTSTFRFVLTGENGKHQYGFCRRVRSFKNRESMEGDTKIQLDDRLPQILCFCILSSYSWISFHDRVLDIIEDRFMVSLQPVNEFIEAILHFPYPETEKVFTIDVNSVANSLLANQYSFVRPNLFSNMNFKPLFENMLVGNIMCLFAALLLERRIVIYSTNLPKLTNCIHAVVSTLHPLKWHYIYVPILPNALLDYCMAPMPFLVGVHSSAVKILKKMPTEEIFFVDLDEKNVELPNTDLKILPDTGKLRQNLEFNLLQGKRNDGLLDSNISECFRSWFYPLFGNYVSFLVKVEDHYEFKKDDWLRASINKNNQKFMEVFLVAQMFERFIAESEELGPNENIFEKTAVEPPPKKDIIDQLNVFKAIGSERAQILTEKGKTQLTQLSKSASWRAQQQISQFSTKAKERIQDIKTSGGQKVVLAPLPQNGSPQNGSTQNGNVQNGIPPPPRNKPLPLLPITQSRSFDQSSPVKEASLIDFDFFGPPKLPPKPDHQRDTPIFSFDSDIPVTTDVLQPSKFGSQNPDDDWMNGFIGASSHTQSFDLTSSPFQTQPQSNGAQVDPFDFQPEPKYSNQAQQMDPFAIQPNNIQQTNDVFF
eukprot:TRINITY_DN13456_c0_g1_i1.p1 TRINITY_DN13456_c0_g1~~TRINITY_DN13456_c0_g1_i1.p1  ORF type:complete len:655 (+),score=146.82 TRINITY_DN13456_c0_g1_i1:67-2031(+)